MQVRRKEQSNQIKQLKSGQKIALISTIVLILLALLKASVGYRFNSPLLIADALHSGADILINFSSLIGLWLAARSKSAKFPYGLYRAETVACLLIGCLIIFVGLEISKDGFYKLFQLGSDKKFPLFPVTTAIISSLVACFLAIKQRRVGKAIGSQALLTTSREAFFDIFTSLVVLAGILLAFFRIPYVEGAVIILISILILKLGLETVWTSLMVLLDANLDIELQSEIEDKINRIYGVKGVGDVKIRQSGPFKMVECVIETRGALPLYKAHEMADNVEDLLLKEYENIESVFIQVEPEKENIASVIIPVHDINGLESKIHGHFGRAPYFIILQLKTDHTGIEDFYLNEFLDEKGHIGLKVVKAIISYKLDIVFTSSIGEISFHMLKNNFVDIYRVDEGITVKEVIKQYRLKQLDSITEPTHTIEKSQIVQFNR